jgi:arsenate reductase
MNSVFRIGLCAALLLTAFVVGSAAQTTDAAAAPRVIFVCEHGAAKSVIAAAYFNKIATERGLPDRATYRGASP